MERPALNAAAQNPIYLEMYDQVFKEFDAYMRRTDTWFAAQHPNSKDQIALLLDGVWSARDAAHLLRRFGRAGRRPPGRESSDIGLPLVGVGLLYTEGYFSQRITEDGWQEAINNPLDFDGLPLLLVRKEDGSELTIQVEFPDGPVQARIWEVRVGRTPLYLLDTNMSINPPMVRRVDHAPVLVGYQPARDAGSAAGHWRRARAARAGVQPHRVAHERRPRLVHDSGTRARTGQAGQDLRAKPWRSPVRTTSSPPIPPCRRATTSSRSG